MVKLLQNLNFTYGSDRELHNLKKSVRETIEPKADPFLPLISSIVCMEKQLTFINKSWTFDKPKQSLTNYHMPENKSTY